MIALERSETTRTIGALAARMPRPRGILCVSAHWYGAGQLVQSADRPRQIYDMYGFPPELYELTYEPAGSRELTERVVDLLGHDVAIDDSWGIDHGAWSVLTHLYPEADVPVVQLSVDGSATPEVMMERGARLACLADEGWLLMGSGNVVHNLREADWSDPGGTEPAVQFDAWVDEVVRSGELGRLSDYRQHPAGRYAVPTIDHYAPLLYIAGAVSAWGGYEADVFNGFLTLGSISMRSYVFWPDEGSDR